jgi:hypothetical protein
MTDDHFFQPDQVSPADSEIKIIDLQAEPYQDLRRIKVNFRLPYFQEPLNATITLNRMNGEVLTSVDVVNLFQPQNEVTLHIPGSKVQEGDYQVELVLFRVEEHEAESKEKGDIQLTTQLLTSRTIKFSIP